MAKQFFVCLALLCGATIVHAQKLMGIVVEQDGSGKDQPLPGATVHWLGTSSGTTTRDNGVFLIDRISGSDRLVVSFVGYKADTMLVQDQNNIKVVLVS